MQFITKSKWYLIIFSLVLLVIGTSFILWPGISTSLMFYLLGAALIIFGAVKVIGYFVREHRETEHFRYDIAIGFFMILCGALFVFQPQSILNILQTLIGLALFADAAFKLQLALDAYRMRASNWWILLVFAAVTLAVGLLAVLFDIAELVIVLIGVAMIVASVENIASVIFISKYLHISHEPDVVYFKTENPD